MLLFPLPAQIYFYNPHAISDLAGDYSFIIMVWQVTFS